MMKGQTTFNPPTLNAGDCYAAFKMMFNIEAQEVFKTRAYSLAHQYNEPIDERYVLYGLFELAALLGVKTAQNNPCINMFQRKIARVRFFGFTCTPENLDTARNKLIEIVNDMAMNKWLIASMYNLGTLEFAYDPLIPETKKIAVFSYLAVRPEFDEAVNQAYSFAEFSEGGAPPEFK